MYHLWASLLLLCATVVHAEEYYVSQHPAKVVPNKIYAFAMPEGRERSMVFCAGGNTRSVASWSGNIEIFNFHE